MTTTANLTITHLTANQNNPDVTENESKDIFDGAIAGLLTHNMASDADYTLLTTGTPPYEWQNSTIEITDTTSPETLTTGRNIIVPDNNNVYIFVNNTAQTLTLKTSAGSGIAVATLKTAFLRCDGTNVVRVTADV